MTIQGLTIPTSPDLSSKVAEEFDQFFNLLPALITWEGENAVMSCDTETNAEDCRDGRGYGTGISLAFSLFGERHSIYIPIRHVDDYNNLDSVRKRILVDQLERFPGILVFHNAKFDLVSLRTMGVNYVGKYACTMLMAHMINENMPMSKSLESCVKFYLDGVEGKKDSPAFKKLIEMFGWGNITYHVMKEYAEWDAVITLLLYLKLKPLFDKEVKESYQEHKWKFNRVVIGMESYGVRIDVPFSVKKAQLGVDKQHELLKELKRNPGSPADLKVMLLDELKLPVVKYTKTGLKLIKAGKEPGKDFDKRDYASFDKEAMGIYDEILERDDNPLAKKITAFRGWQKTTSSNYKAYLSLISPDGRLRPNYKLHGTKTGRMSCEMPNLQQIPRESDKEWNGDLKQAFIAQDGYTLWEFDYSQLELRLATAYADERDLKKVFVEGRDIFTEMARTLGFSRQDTKTFVYSVQYGAGLDRIAAVFKVSRDSAEQKRETYRNSYPGFRKVEALASARCKAVGKVALWSGRYRHFWSKRDDAHKAFNSVIQGGAADIVEHIMVRLWDEINDPVEARMLLQVHDSVVFEIRNDRVSDLVPKIESIMEDVKPDFGVKFAVKGKVWGSKE